MKKAQGLPLNTIILAAIAIVVMIVIIMFFTNKFSQSNDVLNDCASKGGEAVEKVIDCKGGIPTLMDKDLDKPYCCIKLTNS